MMIWNKFYYAIFCLEVLYEKQGRIKKLVAFATALMIGIILSIFLYTFPSKTQDNPVYILGQHRTKTIF